MQRREAWHQRAACDGLTWWWDDHRVTDAKRVCARCPVMTDCLITAFAADTRQEHQERVDDLRDALDAHAAAVDAPDPDPVRVAATERAVDRARRALERPLTGRPRSTFGVWGGTGPLARRAGAAAYRAGGDVWAAALADHVAWLGELVSSPGRPPAHPWNRTGREAITHGRPGSYNKCTAGPGGGPCEACGAAKAIAEDRRSVERRREAQKTAA